MGIANDLKRIAMLGRFAPKTLASLALFIVIFQCLYNKQAIAKPRPNQYLAKEQWTGNVQERDYRHWSDLSIEGSINGRDRRSAVDREDSLEGQKGFKVLTTTNDKREGIQTPIEALKTEGTSLENTHEPKDSRSNVNEPNKGSGGSTNALPQNTDNISQENSATGSSLIEEKASGSGSNISGNVAGEKRGEVTLSSLKAEESKSHNAVNNANSKQDGGASSAASNDNDKTKTNNNQSTNSPKPEDSPSSVTVQGNTVNGQPIRSSSSSSSSEPIKDPVGNSGSEVVTSHPPYENESENSQFPYRDARSKDGSKGSSEPEVGHFQVDDKSADLEINANSAGVKVKAKPASLQVVSRPGAHPPTPVVPIAPIHPYYHHHPHYYPFLGGFRRSRRPYHTRLYDNPYHAHYRAWIPPPGHHHYRPYFDDPEDVPFYRRAFNPYRYGYHHRHHHHHHRYPMPDLYERSDVEDMYHFPMYRRRFRGPYRRGMYERRPFGVYDMPESRFHIPRIPREFVRHDIVTPVPPPVNVYGNPPPGILNGEAANMFGMVGMSGMGRGGMNGMNAFNGMPEMGSLGMVGFGMNGPPMPGMNGPGFNGLGMNTPGMFEMMGMNDQLSDQEQFNGISRSLGPRNVYSEPRFHVKKAAIQDVHKKSHVKPKAPSKKKAKNTSAKKRTKIFKHSKLQNFTLVHARNSTKSKHRFRRSAETEPKKKTVKKLRPQKVKEQKGNRKNSIVIHRPPIIYHPPPEIYHRPDIVVHRAPIMLHRPSIIYHQPPVVVHRPAIIYHQPSIVFHQPPPVVHQPIMHSHDTYVTRPMVLHSGSMVSHPMNYLGIPNHVYSDYEGFHGDEHEGFHGNAFRKHSVPHDVVKTVRAEIQGKIFKKSETSHQHNPLRPKRDIYTKYLDNLDYLSEYWKPKGKRHVKDDFDAISSKEASLEALTYKDVEPLVFDKRNKIPRYQSVLDQIRKKRDIDADELDDDYDNSRFIRKKKKKDVVVNRPPIIYHPPPEVYHRPDIVVHRPPLVIHRPPIIYHQPPVIVHRPAVVYHQPPIVFHQPPPAVSQPLLFSHDSFTIHPSFFATHHGSVVRDYGHYIGIPNIVSNYGAPLFHSGMGKRSKISKPAKKKSVKNSLSEKPTKKSKLHHKKTKTENPHKKNSVVIRRPPIIYHPPPEIYHRPDIVVHRAPIMIHRAPIVYHQPPVVVHRPAIVYHQPSLVFHQPPAAVHQPLITSHDTWVTHEVPVPFSSRVTHHTAYVGIPKHAYMNFHDHWGGHDDEHAYYKSEVPQNVKGSQRDNISKAKKRTVKKRLKHKLVKEEKAKRKNSVMIKRPPIIYHPPPEIFHRPDIVVHRPPILVHRAPIVYHQPPVIVHRPPIVYHQPNIVFHQPMPMVHQPIMKSHDTWVTRPAIKLYGSTMHRLGAVTQYPHAYYNGHHDLHYMAYGKSKVPKKEEKAAARNEIKHEKASVHDGEDIESSGDDDGENDEIVENGSGSAYGELDIEVVPENNIKSNLHKSKIRTELASKKDRISKVSNEKQQETTVKGSKKNSVVIHRPPIIYHPPPEIYHRPDIVVHRAPIVLYRAPIIYHQPPVVVHRPAIVYHQPSIVFHQPPPMVHQPIMHSHDNYVTHSVAVPVGSHVTHVMNYHGVPHEEIYMEGIGHGAFAKSMLPLRKGHKRDKIKSTKVSKGKNSENASKRSRRALEEEDLFFGAAETPLDVKQPIGASERIKRVVEQPWISNLGEDVNIVIKRSESNLGLGLLSSGDKERSINGVKKHRIKKRSTTKNATDTSPEHNKSHSKKTVIIIRRPPILFHPPSHVIHRPNIMVHRPPFIVHRHPLIIHRPPILVHRMPIIIHRPPVLIHRMPLIVRRPDLMFHRPPILIHRMPYVIHPHPWLIHRPPIVIHKGPHMMIHHSSYIHHYPSHVIHMHQCHGCGCHGGWCGKSNVPKIHTKNHRPSRDVEINDSPKSLNDKFASDLMVNGQGINDYSGKYKFSSGPDFYAAGPSSYDFKVSENLLKESEGFYRKRYTNRPKRSVADSSSVHAKELNERNKGSKKKGKSSKKKKKDVVVSRPPIIYHPPPEVYHRPEIVVHRAPILIHRPPIVYHQPPVVVHRPAVVYHQPPIVFHQPPPSVNQPLLYSHDQFVLHPASVAQHINSVVNEAGHYVGIPHGAKENYPGPLLTHPFGAVIPPLAAYHVKRGKVQRPNDKDSKSDTSSSHEDENQDEASGEGSGDNEIPSRRAKTRKNKQSKGQRKNNVLVYRPPMIYHPPPEIYDRPDIVVHRPDLVIHRPSIVYHQPSVVIHRPPIIYHQPPVMFHQPPPLNHQPIVHSHDAYVAHGYLEPYGSVTHHAGSYVGAPHFYPGENAYGWGMQGFHGPLAAGLGFGFKFGPAFGRSKVQNASKKSSKEKKKAHEEKASKKSKHRRIRHKRSNKHHHHHHWHHHHKDLKRHAYHGFDPVYTLMEQRESFITDPLSKNYLGESSFQVGEPAYTKSKVAANGKSKRSTKEKSKTKEVKKHKKGERKNTIVVHRPSMIYHPPPEIYDRPDVVVHRPDIVIHRPSVVYHQPSVVVHRPPVIYHEPPVVFHQPSPMVHHPVIHSHDTYVGHPFYEPYASHVEHAGSYVGAPHFFGGGFGYGYGGFGPGFGAGFGAGYGPGFGPAFVPGLAHGFGPGFGPGFVPGLAHGFGPGFGPGVRPAIGRSKIEKGSKSKIKSKKRSRRSTKTQKKASKTGSKKNMVLIQRPPMIYHPPPEIYDRPDVIVHRPDLVIHRPSIVYHQPSVVIHRPPVIYQQPPVVFHQPPPLNSQPVLHAHDSYIAHTYHEPVASSLHHAGTYVGAPHFYPGGWGVTPNAWGPAFGKSKVPKGKSKGKREGIQRSRRDVEDKSKKIEKKTKTSKSSKGVAPGHKKNVVVMRRPSVIYHPPPEVYHRPDVILHRPDIVIHRPSVVFHQSAVIIHRPPVVYHQPPLVFHQPTPMVHQPILHSHETYLPHHYFEPAGAHVVHAGTYVGAPHFYHGGWGWGYGYHAGHAFGKSKVEDTADGEAARKAKSLKKTHLKDKEKNVDEEDNDDDEGADDERNTAKSKSKSRRSLKTVSKSHKSGNKKNIVVMRRPPVVYHPPPEVYHRPDVVLHRPDIVIHRPSVVFHQSPVVIHRPSVVYHQPPIVFHQPTPMVHQPIVHSHDTYLAHHFYEPFHTHVVHAGTYVGAPHFFGGGWGWGYGHGHGHAFGKSKVEKAKTYHHHKTKRDTNEDKHSIVRTFQKFLQKRSVKGSKKNNPPRPSRKGSKKSVKGSKKNMVLIQRPPMIYHPPPEIYDRPNIIVHRPDLVYHQPSIVYHQSSVVVHRAPVIYHPPPVVFHQPPPLVHQNVLHSHDSYIGHRFYEPFASHISHGQTYVGAPHFFGGGWGYGYGLHGPLMHPVGPWNGFGPGPAMFRGPSMYNGPGFHGPNGMVPFNAGFHGFAPQAVRPFGPAFAKSDVERPKGNATKKSHKAKHTRKSRSLSLENKKTHRAKSRSRHHKGLKKNVVVMHRAPIMFHPPPEVYHRPDIVIHRPDVVIHRPSIVVHQAPVVIHKPAVVYHQSPVVLHQPPPVVHQPLLYSHDAYVPHTYYEPFGSAVAHTGTYFGAPNAFDGGWGYGYGHVVGGFGKSKVEKTKYSNSKKAHKGTKKSKTVKKQENASKKVNILHPEAVKDVNAEKKNDIVVNRPPIIYHPPPEVYHRPDIVVHRAPIVVHRPPIIYHQPPVVVHRPAVVYHQPPIVFHQPPPAVHQPIIHSHDTFVVHHTATYEPHGSTVSHQSNFIGIPSHVEHFEDGFDYHGGHGGYNDDFVGYHGYHGGFHGGYHGGYHGYRMLHRSNIEHANKFDKVSDSTSEESSSTKSTITKTKAPVKNENTNTVITDKDQPSKTVTKRQILGSHSLFLPESPLNVAHPKGPIVERLQKMSTIPGIPKDEYEHHVAKRDLDSQKEKRQVLVNPGIQAPLSYALTPQRVLHPIAGHVAAPLVAYPPAIYPRLPLYQPLLQAPYFQGYPSAKPPGVNVHVETDRSTIPNKKKKMRGRQKRQVLPMMQTGVLGNVPHLLYNQAPVLHETVPQVPQQIASPFLGFNPMMLPSFPLMNYLPQRRPHVNINVQSMRSSIPSSKRKKKSVSKKRSKRQLLPQMINPYALALNYLTHGYNPYWNMNMNPFYFRQSPGILNDDDGDESEPEPQNVNLMKQYLTNLYEYYTGEKFDHKRPKVDVEVHASKSNIPGSSASNIVVRSKRQMFTYLPQSPLTTGRYDIPVSGPLSSILPIKRSKFSKPKRSTKKYADKKMKKKDMKNSNSKRDEFAPQGKTEQSNLIQMNPDDPGASLLGNGRNTQFSRVQGGAEEMNEIGPGGLNGAIGEPQEQQLQTKSIFEGNTPEEPRGQESLQQELMQQQEDFPVAGFQGNNLEQVPNFPQLQEMQAQDRMELPVNDEQLLRLRGQVPFFPPGPQIPLEQKPLFLPGPSRAFFLPPAVAPPQPLPLLRPFAPFPFAQIAAQQAPLSFPMQSPMASFFPEQQGTINVNVNTVKSKLPRVKSKKKTTDEQSNTEKQVVPGADEIKSGDKRQRISLFQRIPAMQVLPQRFLQNGVAVPSFAGNEPRKESQIHGVNGMVISELQMQRKHAIPSKVNIMNIQAGSKNSNLKSHDGKDNQKSEVKSSKSKRQIYGMNELPQEIRSQQDQNSIEKLQTKGDKEQEKKVQKRYIEIIRRASSEKVSGSSKTLFKNAQNGQQVGLSRKKSSLSKTSNNPVGHRKRQFVMPFRVPNIGRVAEQGAQEQVPQVINQYQQHPQQGEQVMSAQQTHVIQEPEAAYGEPVQHVTQIEEPLNHVQSFSNEFFRASEPGVASLGNRPKVQVSVQVAKSSIGKGLTKAASQDKKTRSSNKKKTITKRQLFGTVPLFSPLGRADVSSIAKTYVPVSEAINQQEQVPVVSRRSLINQMHERQDNSKTTNNKQKRQLGDLINNILERRRGPKLLGDLMKKPKENPPIVFTTGNNNNNDEKTIDVFPGNPGGNQNPGEGQPRLGDAGVGNPLAGLLPPPPPLQTNQNPLLSSPALPGNQGMYQDDQSAIAAAQAAQQPPPFPLMRQQEPVTRQNVLQFLQNAGFPNPLVQQPLNLGPQMPAAQFMPPVLPLAMPPPPLMSQSSSNDAASPAEGRSQTPYGQSPPVYQLPPQGAPQMASFALGVPPVFPMMPFNAVQAPLLYPPVPPTSGPGPGIPGTSFNHLFDKPDDERPSVSVNVQTSKSKIPKTNKS